MSGGKTRSFEATLLSDVVLNQTSATAGGHATLDFIPGASFLGAAAARVYELLGTRAFTAFHSGKIRFGNAYPIAADGAPAFPVPLSWHRQKGAALGDGAVDCAAFEDGTTDSDLLAMGSLQQVRRGYVTDGGVYVLPETSFRLKTAIDRDAGGRSMESQLFGYESLRAGSRWWFELRADDDVPDDLLDTVENALVGIVGIGRSRSAEYGRVKVNKHAGWTISASPAAADGVVLVYCVSDALFRDPATGATTLTPSADVFGLPATAPLVPARTFVRSRTYAPFNGKRRANDLQRTVVCKGSVFAYRAQGADLAKARQFVLAGVGEWRQDGLGAVCVAPALLGSKSVSLRADAAQGGRAASPVSRSSLADWLVARHAESALEAAVESTVESWVKELRPKLGKGPSKSQWGTLRQIAASTPTANGLDAALFADPRGFCCHGVSSKVWKTPVVRDVSFAKFVEDRLHSFVSARPAGERDTAARMALHRLASLATRALAQQGREDNR